mgnify:CR=1 FL=1
MIWKKIMNLAKLLRGHGKFIQDIGIIIEFTRGLIYRVMLMDYPTHDIVDTFVNVVYDDDGKKHTEVDMEQLRETIESLHKDEE